MTTRTEVRYRTNTACSVCCSVAAALNTLSSTQSPLLLFPRLPHRRMHSEIFVSIRMRMCTCGCSRLCLNPHPGVEQNRQNSHIINMAGVMTQLVTINLRSRLVMRTRLPLCRRYVGTVAVGLFWQGMFNVLTQFVHIG